MRSSFSCLRAAPLAGTIPGRGGCAEVTAAPCPRCGGGAEADTSMPRGHPGRPRRSTPRQPWADGGAPAQTSGPTRAPGMRQAHASGHDPGPPKRATFVAGRFRGAHGHARGAPPRHPGRPGAGRRPPPRHPGPITAASVPCSCAPMHSRLHEPPGWPTAPSSHPLRRSSGAGGATAATSRPRALLSVGSSAASPGIPYARSMVALPTPRSSRSRRHVRSSPRSGASSPQGGRAVR